MRLLLPPLLWGLGWLTMSFGDPRREAAQAAEMLVQGIDANLTARSKTKN